MEIGFAADGRHRGAFAQSIWCEGEPEKSIWVGIKTRQTQAGLLVTTFRCPACGYLESYAPPPETPIQL